MRICEIDDADNLTSEQFTRVEQVKQDILLDNR